MTGEQKTHRAPASGVREPRRRVTIYSGGQTGADSAALQFALDHSFSHGGWCPRGRRQEDGVIPARFRLRETPSAGYAQRTLWNVRDSDGTIVLTLNGKLTGGTRKTIEFARGLCKPWLHLSAKHAAVDRSRLLRNFLRQHRVKILNVAGPRKSEEPGVGRFVSTTLRDALTM